MKRGKTFMVGIIALIMIASCSVEDTVIDEKVVQFNQLNESRTTWAANQSNSYKFHLYFAVNHSYSLTQVYASNTEIFSAINMLTQKELESYEHVMNISDIFDYIESVLNKWASGGNVKIEDLSINYDKERGFPTELYYKFSSEEAEISKQSISVNVTDFDESE